METQLNTVIEDVENKIDLLEELYISNSLDEDIFNESEDLIF